MRCSELRSQLEDLFERVYRDMPRRITDTAETTQVKAFQRVAEVKEESEKQLKETDDSVRRLEERLNALYSQLEKHQTESDERGETLGRLKTMLDEHENKQSEAEKLDELDLRFAKEVKQIQIQMSQQRSELTYQISKAETRVDRALERATNASEKADRAMQAAVGHGTSSQPSTQRQAS